MGTQNHRMLFRKSAYQLPDLYDLFRVKPYCRFIQYNNIRESQHCLGKTYSLTVSFRQVPDESVLYTSDLYQFFHFIYRFFSVFPGYSLELCRELQIFSYSHFHIKRRLLRQISNLLFCCLRLF